MQKHIKERFKELFQIKYDLLLYDVTSTHFESESWNGPQDVRARHSAFAKQKEG